MRRKVATGWSDPYGVAAFGLYILLASAFFGRSLFFNFAAVHIGRNTDSSPLMWGLVWWPYALKHGLNPFLCRLVWAPRGFNVAWFTGMPLAALLAAPLTAAEGPAVSYNILCLTAVVLAAWSAFLLCRHLSADYAAALLGGYVFGFSSYMLGRLGAGHLSLLLIFPLPLILLSVIAHLQGRIHRLAFSVILALLVVAQFFLSVEDAATALIVGTLGLGLTWYFSDPDQRSRLLELASPLAVAGVMSALIASPYLYYLLDHDTPPNLVSSPGRASSNVLNFLFANTSSELGRWLPVDQLFRLRPGDLGPGDAYFGVPLLIVVVLYARAHWREAGARILLASLGVILTLMLGPRLRVGSWTGFGMPWKLLAHIPMVRNAMPGRYAVYAFLVVGIIAARWIADQKHHPRRRAIVAVLVVAAGLPNLASGFWTRPVDLPAFFAAGSYQRYLRPGEVILPLPFGSIGYTMLWQASTNMYFRMAVGYTGQPPREFDQWPIINAFANTTLIPDATLQLKAFMAAHEVTAIVADDSQLPQWGPLLATIDPAPAHVGGVAVYRFAPSAIAQYGGLSADEMARRDAAARFAALLEAAHRYLAAGQNLAALTPMHAQQMGLIPPGWVDDPDVRTNNGLYLGPWPNGRVAVGLVGSYEALKPLIDQYRSRASAILFPFPRPLADPPQGDTFMRLIVFVFDRATVINPVPQAPSAPAKLRAP